MYAISAAKQWIGTRRSCRHGVYASPPAAIDTIDLADVRRARTIYVVLHGQPGSLLLSGDWGRDCLFLPDLGQLSAPVVFLGGCYNGLTAQYWLDAGARAVVGWEGVTYAGYLRPDGTTAIGRDFWRQVEQGYTVGAALWAALSRWRFGWHGRNPNWERLADGVKLYGDRLARLEA